MTLDASWDGIREVVRRNLVPPPHDGPGICWRCRTWNDRDGFPTCSNCADVESALLMPPIPLSVVSLYRKPSLLRDWLTHYKGRDEDEPAPDDLRPVEHITALVEGFLEHNWARLSNSLGAVDAVVIVPSTNRPAPHPLEKLLNGAAIGVVRPLLRRGPGPLGFRRPAADGYEIEGTVARGLRVLLIDDVYTTGARINSARYALIRNDVEVRGALVLARRVNPDYHPDARILWETQSAQKFEWATSPYIVDGRDCVDDIG